MARMLAIGTKADGSLFELPADLGDKKIALLAQSNKGKTYGLGDILEELEAAHQPFIATDPANNLYGLRVLPDGRPSGRKVVIIGGDHADIPFEKDQGERMAESLLATPICAVIDLAFESRGSARRFMTDFSTRLMRTKPEIPRVVVLEECPELIPQNAFGVQAQMCKAAVSKVATIGGNFGYGVIAACQRPATMDKDVLSQCEALIVMGMTHKKDRKTVQEWMEAKDIGERAAAAFAELGSLKPGEAWLWWPGEDRFERFTFRKRETLHPREMNKLGLKASAVKLGDMQAFVEKMKRELSRTVSAVPAPPKLLKAAQDISELAKNPKLRKVLLETNAGVANALAGAQDAVKEHQDRIGELAIENGRLRSQVQDLAEKLRAAEREKKSAVLRLEAVRDHLRPQWEALQGLFNELGEVKAAQDRSIWEPWLQKAGQRGCKRMLEVLIEKGELTRNQLGTLSNVASTKSTFRNYLSWLKTNGLVEVDRETVKLRTV
jgi:hypothetical protein